MVCRRCVPLPRPAGGVAELPQNVLDVVREVLVVGDAAGGAGSAEHSSSAAALAGKSNNSTSDAAAVANGDGAAAEAHPQQSQPQRTASDDRTKGASAGAAPLRSNSGSGATGSAARGAGGGGSRKGAPSGPTSRQLKVEADRKYEAAEYTAALELYSKAIQLQPQDGHTQLRYLYGNRSAAHFMAQRYEACVADCLEVVRLEPGNVKMISRAARSAATMGDLEKAIKIMEGTPAARVTETMSSELARYRSGLDLYTKAESGFGTPEGDERYRMLVAQFSETVPFRIRFAESLMQQKLFARAAETLEVTSSSSRPPRLCFLLGQCFYQSGFERFDQARRALREAAQLDEECAELLRLVNNVDERKMKGNATFTERKFAVAVEHYTAAITLAEGNVQILRILYCNRAAAYKEIGRFREGVDDCTQAIALDKDFHKAYARRARCHQCLGDHFAAVQDFRTASRYDADDRDLARELRQAEQLLSKEAEREKDYYYQLGLTSTATDKEIKVKYRELSLRWHPDKCVNLDPIEKERAEHKFKVISESYATLIDPAKRREYDVKMSRSSGLGGRAGFGGFPSSYSTYRPNDHFRGHTRAGGTGFW